MEEIRNACQGDDELTNAIKESTKGCIELIKSRFERVVLKGTPIAIGESATSEDIPDVFNYLSLFDGSQIIVNL